MQLSGIRDLANSIANNTATVEGYFIQNNLALPSFELDAPPKSLIPTDAINIEAARVRVIDDTLQLRRLMLGPLDYLMSFTVSIAHLLGALIDTQISSPDWITALSFSQSYNPVFFSFSANYWYLSSTCLLSSRDKVFLVFPMANQCD